MDLQDRARRSGVRLAHRLVVLACLLTVVAALSPADVRAGEYYGSDAGGSRYSPLSQVNTSNVDQLTQAWTFHTGDMSRRSARELARSKFEVTPILVDGHLLVCSPYNEVIALDPADGHEQWRFDPHIATNYRPANLFTCRGVAFWRAPTGESGVCTTRVLTLTNDARLIELDLADGKPCQGFGNQGEITIDPGKKLIWPGEFQMTSPPAVLGDTVIVGSSIGDNQRVDEPRGTVRAFDVRTGTRRWEWDPIPTRADDPAAASWGDGWRNVGASNVWAPIAVDEKRRLVFLPTTSPSPDFYGGLRPGDDLYSDSVVALNADSGQRVWSFQTVHHDIWDYDVASQPSLATIHLDGRDHDVVIQGTKQGLLFVLDRDTGRPVLPVEERPVPQEGAVAGEKLSPTQPFPVDLPPLSTDHITAAEAYGLTPWDRGACAQIIAGARHQGRFTPPSLEGTLEQPFTGGGTNWGGVAVDPEHAVVFANTSNLLHLITLFPADQYEAMDKRFPDKEVSEQAGAPYGMKREVVLSPLGLPCNPPPWGTLAAVDLNARKILWQVPIGTTEALSGIGLARELGTPTIGGPLATRGGLVFIGATLDNYLRAIDARSGNVLWTGPLPAAGIATPSSYEWRGRQYIVIAAGGHGDAGAPANDAIVAFALPAPGQAVPSALERWIHHPGGRLELHALLALAVLVAVFIAWRRWRVGRRK